MKHFDKGIGIVGISPTIGERTLLVRAKQLSHFMGRIQGYYVHDLGLTRIDTDPPPNPEDPKEVAGRLARLHRSESLYRKGLEYIGAFALKDNRISDSVDAMQGLLVLSKPERLCAKPNLHTPTEIAEWNVDEKYRWQGLGRYLLEEGMYTVHPDDEIIADVAETNLSAQAVYSHYGFEIDSTVDPMPHEVFDTQHLRMHVGGAALRTRLGFEYRD